MGEVAVVDCGMGNLHSVVAAVRRVAPTAAARITSAAEDIENADKVIFPGDGHFAACMREIDKRGLRQALLTAARQKPFFGVCVGMQVLFAGSEESDVAGLGIFPQTVRRLPPGGGRKIPHMGWNQTRHRRRVPLLGAPPTGEIDENTRFYYIHSYYAPLIDETLMTARYGVEFSAVLGDGRMLATQFHPEKSGQAGLRLLEKFLHS